MKRFILFSLALIVILSTFVTSPQRSAAQTASLANFFPLETFAYSEIDTEDLPATVKTLSDLLITISPGIPANWMEMISQQASQQAGHDVTFEKDLIGWIGPRAAIGVLIPAETFKATLLGRSGGRDLPKTQTAGLITVKDEALADAFLKLARFTPQSEPAAPINGEAVTLYTDASGMHAARWKGYLAIGDVDLVLNTQRVKKATLDTDTSYQKMLATLKPGTLASVFVRTPLAASSSYVLILGLLGPTIGAVFSNIVSGLTGTPTPTPSPTPQPSADEDTLADAVFALGYGIHSVRAEGKNLILESSTWINPDALKQLEPVLKLTGLASLLTTDPKPIEGTLIDKIPASASAVLLGTDIHQIYDVTLGFAAAVMAAQQLTGPQHKVEGNMLQVYKGQIEFGLRGALGVEPETDLLHLLEGDFALYLTQNDKSLLQMFSVPADVALLITVPDADKTQSILATLNDTISKQAGKTPAAADAKGLYTLELQPGMGITYGLVDDTLLVTSNKDTTTAALAGDGILSSDATWSSAIEILPEEVSQVWYLNAANLQAFLQAIDTSANPSMAPTIQQLTTMAAVFDSALIYYRPAGDGVAETAFILTQK
jgi:hypothetical protein